MTKMVKGSQSGGQVDPDKLAKAYYVFKTHHGTVEHPRPSGHLIVPSEMTFQLIAGCSRRKGNEQRTR
jgi:hypothetical protein